MLRQYNSYELNALKQLSEYRNSFFAEPNSTRSKKASPKNPDNELSQKIEKFTELFCENNFADADYSIIQKDQYSFESLDEWIDSMEIGLILQCITYIIWTNKSNKGYFVKKINDCFLIKILGRLHVIIEEFTSGKSAANIPDQSTEAGCETASVKKNNPGKGFLAFF